MPSEEEFCNAVAKQELSYDAWGRLRNPATQVAYAAGSEPALFIGRGYTGHEHLPWFGLVNMNARLYDPLLGKFLAPDPYVKNPFLTQDYNRYTYAMNNPLVYIDQDGEFPWLIVGIVAAFTYLKAAHDNTPKADQGNPSKWNWAPWNWGKPEEIQIHIGGNTDGSGMHGGISAGKSGQPQPMVGYNKDKGPGIGYNYNGSSQMYHPGYDYNKAEKATETAIQEAVQTFFSASGVAGSFLENSNATFRITNGAYNGSQISPKIYSSGWKGGSKAKITTYSLSKVGKATSLGSGIITTGYAYNDIINNQNTNPVTYVDAGVGTAGILSSAASYYAGVQIPYVGEAVAIYGTMRLTWDTFFYLGANYGPSKWYGTDDTKWFK